MASGWLLLTVFLLWSTVYVHSFTFYSPEGFKLVRKILLAALPTFEPHNYQLDGLASIFFLVLALVQGSAAVPQSISCGEANDPPCPAPLH
ncbi:hypothetical protein DFH09DRAFT_1340517 [Mycena vulgaris]|nr:hypothetical protein DFH09DRAFT_1340517 [Mycena vulgaris]